MPIGRESGWAFGHQPGLLSLNAEWRLTRMIHICPLRNVLGTTLSDPVPCLVQRPHQNCSVSPLTISLLKLRYCPIRPTHRYAPSTSPELVGASAQSRTRSSLGARTASGQYRTDGRAAPDRQSVHCPSKGPVPHLRPDRVRRSKLDRFALGAWMARPRHWRSAPSGCILYETCFVVRSRGGHIPAQCGCSADSACRCQLSVECLPIVTHLHSSKSRFQSMLT